jgi:hypothetical protein
VNIVMAVAMVHAANGFFMNWHGTLKGEGFEYNLLAAGIALAVMINGGGKWSLDRLLRTNSNHCSQWPPLPGLIVLPPSSSDALLRSR